MQRTIASLAVLMPSLLLAQVTIDPTQVPTLLESLSKVGAGVLIASFVIWLYRKDMREKVDELARVKKDHADERERDLLAIKADREFYLMQWKGQADIFMRVVIDNTAAMVSATKTSEALHRREDQIAEVLARLGYDIQARKAIAPIDPQ